MSEINIRELAKKLDLSISSVSKALSGSHEISAETRARVAAMARELNYKPNPYARSLRRKKSNTIAVVIPEVADSFFSLALKGIESVANDKGYHVLVYLTYESFEKERAIMEDFKSGRVDGVLVSISTETAGSEHIAGLTGSNVPVVYFDRIPEEPGLARVGTNDFESSYQATQHLLKRGCRKVAYLSISKNLSINNKRREGYFQALKDYPKERAPIVIECSNDAEENIAILQEQLQQERPDGLIASVEKLTSLVYLVCQKLKISIPDQLKVLSFCNLETAPILHPPLTTVVQPAFDIGKTAAGLLFRELERKRPLSKKEIILLPSRLVIRESTQ
ncbi:LacI family DNA-binding transcriptional regulator [Paraflavisolibacter sp. H34]|uniref:LacI family DNA-binding transcriptional regulator n=1 Tax=Huijunlia imazamoxiresistens TaxID=3127457 RepID=UPI00301933AD